MRFLIPFVITGCAAQFNTEATDINKVSNTIKNYLPSNIWKNIYSKVLIGQRVPMLSCALFCHFSSERVGCGGFNG